MRKPYVGITSAMFYDKDWNPPISGHRQSYVDAIAAAGGVPLLIPLIEQDDLLWALYERIDGLLLAGGHDVEPKHYGEEPHERLGPLEPIRDRVELQLTRRAAADGKPILGICRGLQVLNVALGGTLYQDIVSQLDTSLQHEMSYQCQNWQCMAHELHLAPDSQLARLLAGPQLQTNSLHHQAIKQLAPGLRAVGWAPDGVIEAVESTNGHFMMGVQCHPEALTRHTDQRWQALFAAFVESCRVEGHTESHGPTLHTPLMPHVHKENTSRL